jgi:hypothetical protein
LFDHTTKIGLVTKHHEFHGYKSQKKYPVDNILHISASLRDLAIFDGAIYRNIFWATKPPSISHFAIFFYRIPENKIKSSIKHVQKPQAWVHNKVRPPEV